MNDVHAPKRSSLKPRLVKATMFLKLNMSLISNNPTDVTESHGHILRAHMKEHTMLNNVMP